MNIECDDPSVQIMLDNTKTDQIIFANAIMNDRYTIEGDSVGIFAGKHALLAEDVALSRMIVMGLLKDTAINIDWAGNGKEACSLFANNPDMYDLILMDINMPEMDGYEAVRRIRSMGWSRAANIPIIAITGNVFKEEVDRCLAMGMDDHVGKPISRDDMIAKMKRYLA